MSVENNLNDWTGRVLDQLNAYFEHQSGSFWAKDNQDDWIRLNIESIKRRLQDFGYHTYCREHETISQISKIIVELEKRRSVHYAGPLAGHDKGVISYGGKRLLVTDSPQLIEPVKGDWPLFRQFSEGLLDAENSDQLIYFNGWMKTSLEARRAHIPRPAQALVFTGKKDCGKSLLQNVITELLGGRMARPYLYMSGHTPFNGNWFGAEHLVIEDEQPYTDIRSRRNFGTKIKEITAIDEQNAHRKFRDAITLPVFWRLTISVNDETEDLMILPPFDDSIQDKLMLFKVAEHPMPMPTATLDDRMKFRAALSAELPAYVYHLLSEWKIDPALVSQRYGITHYQHPEILFRLNELAPETYLLLLIDQQIFKQIPQPDSWEGTSLKLEQELTYPASSVRRQAENLFSWQGACGTYLGRLRKLYPNRISSRKVHPGQWIWTILPP
jgi:hypothetical protein